MAFNGERWVLEAEVRLHINEYRLFPHDVSVVGYKLELSENSEFTD